MPTLPFEVTFHTKQVLLYEPHSVDSKPLARTMRGTVSEVISGARTIETTSELPGNTREYVFACETREETRFLEDFFDARLGAAEGFFMPTWQWELEIGSYWAFFGSIAISIPKYLHYADKFFPVGEAYRYLATLAGDAASIHRVGGVNLAGSPPPDYDLLHLTSQLDINGGTASVVPLPWTMDSGARPLWLRYSRFASDRIDVKELGAESSLVTVHTVEIPKETPS